MFNIEKEENINDKIKTIETEEKNPTFYKKLKTKNPNAAKVLKVTGAALAGGTAGAAIPGSIGGAVTGILGATVVAAPIIPVLAAAAVVTGSFGAVAGAFEAGKMAAKKFDKKQKSQKLDLTEEEKHTINSTDFQTKTKIESKKSISV